MMKHFSLEPFRNWFGYTRRERRSSFFLLIIIAFIAGIRFIVPSSADPVKIIIPDQEVQIQDTVAYKKSQIVRKKSFTTAAGSRKPIQIVDLNACDSASLEALPGIGRVLSVRIIKYRNLLGGYASVDQLKEVYGLTEETFNLIKDRVRADPSAVRKIDINTADYKQLIRIRYLEKFEVTSILKYRELKGKINNIEDLIENKIITEEKAGKIKWYLEF